MNLENRVSRRRTCLGGGLALFLLSSLLYCGCSSPQPYKDQNSWLVRENGRPQYFALYDIFYLSATNYAGTGGYPYTARVRAVAETVDLFGVHTRVFAPIYRDAQDVEDAFDYYIDTYHGNGLPWPINEDVRPFVFIGEGMGATLLKDLAERESKRLRKRGFVGGWYSPDTQKGFMTATTVRDINDVVRAELYKKTWGRDGR